MTTATETHNGQTIPERIEAVVQHAKDCPPPYRVTDIIDRVANDRPISAGMARWLASVPSTATASQYRLDILRHVDRTHGGVYWAWSLVSVDGQRREGGRVDDLPGEYDLDDGNATVMAGRVADQVCRQCNIDRSEVVLAMDGRQR